MGEFILLSQLRAPPEALWAHSTTLSGLRHELAPLLRLSPPSTTTVESWSTALSSAGNGITRLGPVRLRFAYVAPITLQDLRISSVEPGKRFTEYARSRLLSTWEHERSIQAREVDGKPECTLVDRVVWETRAWVPELLVRGVIHLIFRHRHRRLLAQFGAGRVLPRR